MLSTAFIMDPLESVIIDHDTTYIIMVEAARRGHAVFHVAPNGVRHGTMGAYLVGRPFRLAYGGGVPFVVGAPEALTGDRLDAVLIRTDPPFDADYLAVTQLLDLLRPRPFIMNRPAGLRDVNEKLGALAFPDLSPPTLVSSDRDEIERFRIDVGGDIVLKPLDGHGGAGILPMWASDPHRADVLHAATAAPNRRVVAQQMVEGAELGDRRILVLGGQPIGALLRRNDAGGFTHNLATGGSAYSSAVTDADRALCRRIAPWLSERGLWFVGIDLLADKLIEINVTSPTCVQEINRLDGVALERQIVDFIEDQAASRSRRSG